jgi:hypothetical protein
VYAIKGGACDEPIRSVLIGLMTFWPTLALAEGAVGTYRGIGSIYYTIICAILIYGVYDTFGKKVCTSQVPSLRSDCI